MTYTVIWEIEIDAESPEAAAICAEEIMHDYSIDGPRPVFDVYSPDDPNCTQIDLETEFLVE